MEHQASSKAPHVLIFPLPLQGHITPMLHLAELLCLANLKVTFLTTTQNHQRLTQYTAIEARFARYKGFEFKAIPEGLPDKLPSSTGDNLKDVMGAFVTKLASTAKQYLRELKLDSDQTSPFTCWIIDGWLSFAYDIANEAGVPVIAFRCSSACGNWAYFCTPKLIEAGELPLKDDEDMDRLVRNVPGMENFLRYRDLPSFCRVKDEASCHGLENLFNTERQQTVQAHGFILNTIEDLEGPILSFIRSHCPRLYTIGPLHAQLKYRLNRSEEMTASNNSSSSLWQVDRSCISWLDQKPDKSVIYVSFGSVTTLRRDRLIEIRSGLVQSNKYFLWVARPGLLTEIQADTEAPNEQLEAGNMDRGCIVSWAPQGEVLAHRAVGGFLTHSGWNSTLESITAGVPMLCLPCHSDQLVNSRYVSEVWKIGLDMKDTYDRNIVAEMINDLMVKKKEELEGSMAKISDLAKRSISEGGSSYRNVDHLIEDINEMSRKEEH